MLKELMQEINELKTQNLIMEAQIAELANSSTTWQLNSSSQPSIQSEEDMGVIVLPSDQEYESFFMCVNDVTIDKEEEHAIDEKINVVVDGNVSEDNGIKESNTEMVVVPLPQTVPKLPFLNRDITYVDQRLGIGKFAFTLDFTYNTPLLENTCFKVDVITKIVQEDISQFLIGCLYKVALMCQFLREEEDEGISLIVDVLSQDVQMTPEKVRSAEKPPPQPPPHVNVKGVRSFRGAEFYRCFVTKFSKTAQVFAQLLLMDVIPYFIDACLENFRRIKITTGALDAFRGDDFIFQKLDIRPSPE